MLPRLTISFEPEEQLALQRMAEEDFRPPKDQLRWLLRQEAQKRGLLSVQHEHPEDEQHAPVGHKCQ